MIKGKASLSSHLPLTKGIKYLERNPKQIGIMDPKLYVAAADGSINVLQEYKVFISNSLHKMTQSSMLQPSSVNPEDP